MYATLGYFYHKMIYNICGICTLQKYSNQPHKISKKLPNTNNGLKYYTEMLFYEVV